MQLRNIGVIILKELQLEEIKKSELNILLEFAKFCDENNLRYFIAYGTLIGTIRHKGFIPWDDDIDIWMPRADYDIFLKTFNLKTENKNLVAISPVDELSINTISKVIDTNTVKIEENVKYKDNKYLGVDIDIFPLDGQPDDYSLFCKYYNKKMKIFKKHKCLITDFSYMNYCKKIAAELYTLFIKYILRYNKSKIDKLIDNINSRYSYESSKYIGSVSSLFNRLQDRFEKEWFEDFLFAEFEGYKFKIPLGYDKILTALYGDYMKLPPENERVTHHQNLMYSKSLDK